MRQFESFEQIKRWATFHGLLYATLTFCCLLLMQRCDKALNTGLLNDKPLNRTDCKFIPNPGTSYISTYKIDDSTSQFMMPIRPTHYRTSQSLKKGQVIHVIEIVPVEAMLPAIRLKGQEKRYQPKVGHYGGVDPDTTYPWLSSRDLEYEEKLFCGSWFYGAPLILIDGEVLGMSLDSGDESLNDQYMYVAVNYLTGRNSTDYKGNYRITYRIRNK